MPSKYPKRKYDIHDWSPEEEALWMKYNMTFPWQIEGINFSKEEKDAWFEGYILEEQKTPKANGNFFITCTLPGTDVMMRNFGYVMEGYPEDKPPPYPYKKREYRDMRTGKDLLLPWNPHSFLWHIPESYEDVLGSLYVCRPHIDYVVGERAECAKRYTELIHKFAYRHCKLRKERWKEKLPLLTKKDIKVINAIENTLEPDPNREGEIEET